MTKNWLVLSSFSAKQNPQQSCGFFVFKSVGSLLPKAIGNKNPNARSAIGFCFAGSPPGINGVNPFLVHTYYNFRKRLETKDQMCAAYLGFALQVPRPGSTELIPFLSTLIITSESDWKQRTKCAQRIWVLLCRFPARDQRS